ncbi:MAG: uracil-DNA glycosylase [Bacteroidales bacterium]|nr:uracil-DNA glycosylase [Bacteroidales bacterium]
MYKIVDENWQRVLANYIQSEEYKELIQFVDYEYKNSTVFPPKELIFNAFNLTAFSDVKVVIIGQDPYHGLGQAQGLCFSVPDGVKQPPSLRNIVKELVSDVGIDISKNGNLMNWAKQGVLMLNAILTVREKQAGSHQKHGWEEFTDEVIRKISENKKNCVFILWGNYAQKKASLIDENKHLIIKGIHPSPLSAHRGFFGSKPFSKTNDYLTINKKDTINWEVSHENVKQQTLF